MVAKARLEDLFGILKDIAQDFNSGRPLPDPQELANRCASLDRDELKDHLVELDNELWVPKALEVLRVLHALKQRFYVEKLEKQTPLIGDIRLEVRPRLRPEYNQRPEGILAEIGAIGDYPQWSLFQTEGWQKVLEALRNKGRLVITAPTGTGKSEVFLLPLLHKAQLEPSSFLLVYPRVALLKDQLWRALKYAANANITIGFQFQGVGARDEFSEKELFDDKMIFRYADCPKCRNPLYLEQGNRDQVRTLRCQNKHRFQVTISREGHKRANPRLLLTTVESLESLYLRPEMEGYLQQVQGIVLDEAHLYDSLYGAHVRHLIQRVERMTFGRRVALLAVSATIARPEEFGEKLLGSKPMVFAYDPEQHGKHLSGIECIYILQQHQGQKHPGSLLVQALMSLGHAILPSGDLTVAFSDSLDGVNRYHQVLEDAEKNKKLYTFRTLLDKILYDSQKCPKAVPASCPIYLAGECWRGILGGKLCCSEIPKLRIEPLKVGVYSSKQEAVLAEHDIVLATSSLEVGVDEEAVSSVVQYGPPRNAAALAQRRGRAARGHERLAYNLLVLGQEATDHFVLQHRVRLLDGQVEPPLNPENPLVIDLHRYIEQERKLLVNEQNRAGRGGTNRPRGTFLWFKKKLDACSIAQTLLGNYSTALNSLERSFEREKAVEILQRWVKTKLSESAITLELAQELDLAEEEFPADVRKKVQDARQELKSYLSGTSSIEKLGRVLESLDKALVDYKWKIEDDQEKEKIEELSKRLSHLHREARQRQAGLQLPLEEHERRYLFLKELDTWLGSQEGRFVFVNPPDDLRRVLRAFFFLHQGLPTSHACANCSQRPPALVPMAYFEYLSPVVYWRRKLDGKLAYETESPASPEVFFYPYRLQYRYGEGDYVALQRTDHRPEWVQSQDGIPVRIEIEAQAKGPVQSTYRLLQSSHLRSLRTAGGGQPIVKFCPKCGRLHHIGAKVCSCGEEQLWSVRLYPRVLSESSFKSSDVRPMGRHLLTTEKGGHGLVKVLGSRVEGKRYRFNKGEGEKEGRWVPVREFSFDAFYRTPLAYEVARTHGIGWELQSLAKRLGLTYNDLAPTALSLLRRTVAAVTGVLPDLLRGSIEGSRVWAWELVDGGGGITQLFEKLCREDPREVFTQMAKTVCCPVYLAEKKFFDNEDFVDYPRRFHLDLSETLMEAEAEYQRLVQRKKSGEEPNPTCSKEDGCPSCLHEPYARSDTPKRSLAERLVLALIRPTTPQELAQEMLAPYPVLPVLLEADGNYYACEL
jgi:superfamily II DNA/RNA helicase